MADNVNKIQPLTIPLAFGINSPATYINAMSWQEAISIFMFKVNECVKLCNDMDEFNKAVRKELAEFNEKVTEEVKKEIQVLYDNGDLQIILQAVSIDFFRALRVQLVDMLNELTVSYNQNTKTLHLTKGGEFE